MRIGLFVAIALMVPACGNDKGAGGGDDLAMTVYDMSAVVGDMTPGGDLAGAGNNGDGGFVTDGGVVGATCTTACDCMPGLGCFNGTCTASNMPVYCCGSADCPSASVCQSSTGQYGRCNGAMPDLSAFDYCSLINCAGANGTARCTNAGCTSCVANGNGGMSCAK
jgi:hypothetical protein